MLAQLQIIEVSEIGVRSAILLLVSPKARLRWLLFPMIHLADQNFYRQVEERMTGCDLVLTEGVSSRVVRAFTASYRLVADPKQGNVVQPPIERSLASKARNSDISGAAFDEAWRSLPFVWRFGLPLAAPLYGFWLRYFANPVKWQAELRTDDLLTNDEVIMESQLPEFFNVVGSKRESKLFAEMTAVQTEWADADKTVGIAWGAKHIGPVAEFLSRRWGYFPRSADWVTVFDYVKS